MLHSGDQLLKRLKCLKRIFLSTFPSQKILSSEDRLLWRLSHIYCLLEKPMKHQRFSANVLALCGILLMGMGLYFMLFRPPVLPEDLRSLDVSLTALQAQVPSLFNWLHKIFWVMGGYIFTTGLLIFFLAVTSFRKRVRGSGEVVTLAGFTSLGWMMVINFLIDSDFKWLFSLLVLLWGLALVLFWFEKKSTS